MPYTITGVSTVAHSLQKETLLEAARTASKMIDQGVTMVKIFDPEGKLVPASEWEAAWWEWAKTTRPSDIGL